MKIAVIPARDVRRFWGNVLVVEDRASCWEWRRSCGSHGYGQYYEERGKPIAAHRFAWTVTKGQIPGGLHVLHRCDNKKCVRPDHLFLGTQADNMRDMREKGRHSHFAVRGDESPCTKVTDKQVAELRARYVGGTRQRPGNALELASHYGITRARVYQLAKGKAR